MHVSLTLPLQDNFEAIDYLCIVEKVTMLVKKEDRTGWEIQKPSDPTVRFAGWSKFTHFRNLA